MPFRRSGLPRAFIAACQIARGDGVARPAYLLLTVAMTVAAWFALSALASPFLAVGGAGANDSIRVENARNRSQPLPLKYAARMASLSGAANVSYFDLQMIQCGDNTVTINAFGSTNPATGIDLSDYDEAAAKRWKLAPIGILASRSAAELCGWHVGQGIEPLDLNGRPLPMQVVGIAGRDNGNRTALAHYDYINRQHSLVAGPGQVLKFYVDAADPADNEALAARIDAEFAHDDPPVTAYPDTAREDARSRFGKVQYLVALVMGALFLCCLLVLASVMAHTANERRDKLGMLRALGFPRRVLVAGYALEVVGIVSVGALLGIALGQLLLHYLPGWLQGRFLGVAPAPWVWKLLPAWLALLTFVALLRPCLLAWRAHPLDCREG